MPRFHVARCALLFVAIAVGPMPAAQLRVQWDDNSSRETGFVIERTTDGRTFVEVATVEANVTSFVDTNVTPRTTYWYRVQAYNSTDKSAFSNVTGFTMPSDGSAGAPDASQNGGTSSRLANLSARTIPGTGDRTLIVGFVVSNGTKSVLLRAVGPGMAAFTSQPVLQDPTLTIKDGNLTVGTNDNWGGTDRLDSAFRQLGAFPLPDASRDAAIIADFAPRGYTMLVDGAGSGLAMAEIYDADPTATPSGRLVNLSVRAQTGIGDGVLILGFVISGDTPMRVLMRAIGPTLSLSGLSTALGDPQLELFRGGAKWDHNDDWAGASKLESAFSEAGAFRLPNPASRDAALVVLLPPGAYTAIVSGVNRASGVVLAEVYELP